MSTDLISGEALTESTMTAEAAATSSITHVTTRRNDGTTPAKTASQQTTIGECSWLM